MSEDNLVFHCAPTLAGIKNGSLFTSDYTSKRETEAAMRSLNLRLASKGLRVLPLRYSDKKVLVYVYRPGGLARDLEKKGAREILARSGYTSADPTKTVAELSRRFSSSTDFPHEIGLFLSYPPEDVLGFMEKGGRDSKCVGTWKVYGDEEAARRTFSNYKRCTEDYCRAYRSGGKSLEQLTVAAG